MCIRDSTDSRPVCSVVCFRCKEENDPMSKKKVFIGVGHGGSDSGAVGYIVEKLSLIHISLPPIYLPLTINAASLPSSPFSPLAPTEIISG